MTEQRKAKRYETKTGRIRPLDEPLRPGEPPMPATTSEAPADITGVTGVFRVVSEGDDLRRQQDDSPSSSPPAPAGNRSQS